MDSSMVIVTRIRPRDRSIENSSCSEEDLLSTVPEGIEEQHEVYDDEIDACERAKLLARPWWKRPSPWWFFILAPLASIATGAVLAPRVEIITMLVCDQLRPEYTAGRGMEDLGIQPWAASRMVSENNNSHSASSNVASLFGAQQPVQPIILHFEDSNSTIPPSTQHCKTDPVVQAAVARLQATMTTIMGILGVVTVGWWGSMSDRYGRTRIAGINILGSILECLIFIFVAHFAKRLPGGYWLLIIGSIIQGILGGAMAGFAATQAYIADCTDSADRSRAFSVFMGALFVGIALGPLLGGQLVERSGNILIVYYLATALVSLYGMALWIIVPASRSTAQMAVSRRRHALECEDDAVNNHSRSMRVFLTLTGFARPLAIFIPKRTVDANGALGRRNYGLLLVVCAQLSLAMLAGALDFMIQYVLAKFGWTSVETGYWFTLIGATRTFHLMVILPVIFKLWKPKAPPVQLPVNAGESLDGASSAPPQEAPSSVSSLTPSHQRNSMLFDLLIAQGSLAIELVSYISLALSPTASLFVGASTLLSLGAGFGPAAQAIMLELFALQPGRSASEAGTLFGAMSIAQSLVTQVVGPAVFGMLFSATVGVLPQAIFMLGSFLILCSAIMMSFVRFPQEARHNRETASTPNVEARGS